MAFSEAMCGLKAAVFFKKVKIEYNNFRDFTKFVDGLKANESAYRGFGKLK